MESTTPLMPVEGSLRFKLHNDGRYTAVMPQLFTWRLVVGKDPDWYDDGWCYDSAQSAVVAWESWDPLKEREPQGWHRHPFSGRRRPGGDQTQEYINL